jgi:hypothetical protein
MPTDTQEHPDAVLEHMNCSEIALAMRVGGLPYRWKKHKTTEEIKEYARRGITLVGATGIRTLHTETDRLDRILEQAHKDPSIDATTEQAEWTRLWHSHRRRISAIDAAWTTYVHPRHTPIRRGRTNPRQAGNDGGRDNPR